MRERDLIFMLGIGGMGMAPLALYLQQSGVGIAGCDDNLRPEVGDLLRRDGIEVQSFRDFPPRTARVVYSSAVREDHFLYRLAMERSIPLLRRGEMLAETLRGKRLFAIAGSHGKTTTTGMLIRILEKRGFPCGYLMGGLFNDPDLPPARAEGGEWVVAEIDESDGTIDRFEPECALLLNIDWDHVDFYENEVDLEKAFRGLCARTRRTLLIQGGNEPFERLADGMGKDIRRWGKGGDYRLEGVKAEDDFLKLTLGGAFCPREERVRAFGEFNAHNAAAAFAAAELLGAKGGAGSLSDFPGILRRQGRLYDSPRLTVLEDYAHHPEELAALFRFARETWPARNLVVVFQPHRYTRTLVFKKKFAALLEAADAFFLLEVYPACEKKLKGGSSADILEFLPNHSKTKLVGSFSRLVEELEAVLGEPAILLFAGAGDIDQWAAQFAMRLPAREHAPLFPSPSRSIRGTAPPPSREDWWRDLEKRVGPESFLGRSSSLAEKTTLRVGGQASYYAEPGSLEDLTTILQSAWKRRVPVFVLGRGSNLIVSDEGYKGFVIRLNRKFWREIHLLPGGRILAMGGARLKRICGETCRLGLAGFEFLEGIPGSLGGALRMNAGAMGGWIFDIVETVQFMTMEGDLQTHEREAVHIRYRECSELRNAIAVSATLNSSAPSPSFAIKEKINAYSRKRRETQPREPSAGCIFKNPENAYAGQIIDALGLKGKRVGDAQISNLHANFIVNRGGATSKEVISLIKNIRTEVLERRGVELEPEVFLLGKEWSEVL